MTPSLSAKVVLVGLLLACRWLLPFADAQCTNNKPLLDSLFYHPELRMDQRKAMLDEVISCCETKLLNQEPPRQRDRCGSAYHRLGNLLLRIGDFERGKANLYKAIETYEDPARRNDAKTDVANYYSNQGQYSTSIALYEGIIRQGGLKANYIAGLNLVRDLLTVGRLSDAETRWNELAAIEDELGRTRFYLYELKGQIEQDKGSAEQALKYLQRSLILAEEDYGPNSQEVAKSHLNMAENFYLPYGAYSEAIRSFHATLQTYIPDFTAKDIYALPSSDQLSMIDDDILAVLEGRAIALLEQYKAGQGALGRLEQALEGLDRFVETETSLRKFFGSEKSSLFTIAKRHEVMELGLEISYLLYKKTGQKTHIDSALRYSELVKDIVLKESTNVIEASSKRRLLSRELAEQEERLRQQYLALQAEQERAALELGRSTEQEMSDWEEKWSQHLSEVQAKYPNYLNYKYTYSSTNIARIRQHILLKDQALIEYFIGTRKSYAMVISDTETEIVEIPFVARDSTDIQVYIARITGQGPSVRHRGLYESKAIQLYDKLIRPIKQAINLPERLVIIPDGILTSMPFDALIEKHTGTDEKTYLIEHHILSLAYSTSLMLSKSDKSSESVVEYLGFAPVNFPNPANNMPMSRVEVEEVEKIFKGDLLLLDHATFENLLNKAGSYRIVHLATHGVFDTIIKLPYLKLYNGDVLTLSELYLLDLRKVELIILSACESNIGKVVSGEGMMGLSRGFTYAGCYSLMTTLWTVRQEIASPLVIAYSHNLKKGMEKDRALAAAKRKFLLTAEELFRDPYFWAGLVQIGNSERLFSQSLWQRFFSFDRLIYFFVVLILLLGVRAIGRKRN